MSLDCDDDTGTLRVVGRGRNIIGEGGGASPDELEVFSSLDSCGDDDCEEEVLDPCASNGASTGFGGNVTGAPAGGAQNGSDTVAGGGGARRGGEETGSSINNAGKCSSNTSGSIPVVRRDGSGVKFDGSTTVRSAGGV